MPSVAAFAILVALSSVTFGINLEDEGVTAMGAWRVVQGQVPYRDFFAITTPLSFYLLALAFKIGGVTILTERLMGVALGVILVVLTARLSTRIIASPVFAVFPVAVLCQAGVAFWPFPSHHWVANVLVLGSLLSALRSLESLPFRWSSIAGLFAALAFWTLQDQGTYLWLGVGLLVLPWLPKDLALRCAGGWAVGAFLGSLPFVLLLAITVKPSTLWYDLVTFNMTSYRETPSNALGIAQSALQLFSDWREGGWSAAPVTMGLFVLTALTTVALPLVCVPLAAWGWFRKWDPGPRCALLVAGGLSFVATIAHRWGPQNLQWGAVLPAVIVAWALFHWHARQEGKARWIPLATSVALSAAFLFYGAQKTRANLDSRMHYRVSASAGALMTNEAPVASAVQGVLSQVEHMVPPREPVMTRVLPFVNFWTLRPNPAPYDWFMPPDYTTPTQTSEVIHLLSKQETQWIVTRTSPLNDEPFDRYLDENYSLAWSNEAFALWQRKSGPMRQ